MAIALSQIRVEAALDASQYVAGAKAKTDADSQMVAGADKLGASLEQTERRLGTSGSAVERLAKSIDPAYQAQRRLEAGTATLGRALENGTISAERHTQLVGLLQQRYGQVGTQAIASGDAIGRASSGLTTGAEAANVLTRSLFLNRQGLQELQAAGVNSFQALSSGMSVWRVAQTEGAQALGAFVQGGAISFSTIAGWGGIFIALAAAAGLVGARFLEIGANIRSFNLSLSSIASGSTASAEGLQSIVEHLRATGTAAADAKKAIDTVLQAGPSGVNTSAAAISSITEIGRNIGAVRDTGIAEVGTLAAAIGGGADALIKYGLQLNALTAPEAAEIKNLAEHGKQADAVNLAVNRLAEVYSGKYEQSLSEAAKVTIALKAKWDDLLDSLARSGIVDFAIEQIKGIVEGIKTSAAEIQRLIDLFKTLSSALPGGAQAATTAATKAQSDLADALRQRGIEAGAPFSDQQLGAILGSQSVALNPTPSLTGGGLLDRVIGALVQTESGGLQSRISPKGAIGLTQLMPGTAAGLGVNPYDPAQNVAGGTQYLLQQTQRFGSLEAGLQAYNWGPGNYQKYLQGYSQLPASVGAYSSGILRNAGLTGQETALQLSGAGGINYSAPTPAQTVAVQDYTKANADLLAVQKEFTARSVEVQAKLDAERIIREKGLSGLDAENVRTDALATAKQKLANEAAKASAVSQMEADGQRLITKAYGESEAAGLRQVAIENARVAVLNTGADAQKVATDALVLQANQSVAAAEMQSRALDQTVAASKRLAEASASGTAALQDAQVHNQALASTFDALNRAQAAYDQALTTGNDSLIASTKATLDKANALTQQKEEQLKLIAASQETTQVNRQAEQLKNDSAILQEQIGLQGKTTEEISAQVLLLRTKQDLDQKDRDADPARKAALLAQTESYGQIVIKLGEARAAQQRLDEEVRSIADTVANTLGTAIDDVLSGKKIQDWGALFKDMLRQIASTIIQSELIKPLIGSALQSAGFTQSAQQFGTIGQSGGLLSSLLGIGQAAGSASNIASATGLTSSSGGLFGGIGSGITSGVNSIGSSLFGLANPALQGPTLTGATLGESGILGGLSLTGIAGIAGIAGLAIPLITSLFGNKKPSNNAGGLVLDLGSGGISGASGNQANLGIAQQIGSSLATFEQQLLAKIPGATLPGGSVNIVKGDTTGITTDYSGPLGHIKASFGSTQEAVAAFSVAIAKDLGGVSDTLKQTLSAVTDPAQIQAAIDVANAYDKVKRSASEAAAELSGAYDDIFKNVTADTIRSVGPFENVLDQINARFDQLTQSASQYGLSLDPINVGYQAAKDRLAADFNATIAQALQALQDPAQAAIAAEKKAGDQRVQDATAVGADLVALEQYNGANLKKYTDAATKAIADAAKANADAAKANADFTTSTVTSFSGLLSNFTAQAGPFEKALVAVNENFKTLSDQARTTGAATGDIAGAADISRKLIAQSFNSSIADLMKAITDPVQAAIDTETRAGQARVREATAVSGDLNAVNAYNAANLQKVADAAKAAANTINAALQQILTNASETLASPLAGVTAVVKGPFSQALDGLYKTFGDLTTAAKAAHASGTDLADLLGRLNQSLDSLKQSFDVSIQTMTTALTDPFQAALNAELEAGKRRVADAQAVGGDLAAVDEFNRRSLLAVAQAAAAATSAIATASGFNQDIQQQILQVTDPIHAALNAELVAGSQRVAAAQKVGADLAQVDELNRLKLLAVANSVQQSVGAVANSAQQSANTLANAIQQTTDAVAKFTSHLQSLEGALAQLTSGPLSGLTPGQQVQTSTATFDKLLARVKGGEADLIPDLTAAGTSAVQASQAAYGNAKQTADLREKIKSSLQDLATQTGKEALLAAQSTSVTSTNAAQVKTNLEAQALSLEKIADYAAQQSSTEMARTGVANQLLNSQSAASSTIASQLNSQAQSLDQTSQIEAARAQVAAALVQQEAAAAAAAAQQEAAIEAARAQVAAALVQQAAAIAGRAAEQAAALSVGGTANQQSAYAAAAAQQAAAAVSRVTTPVQAAPAYQIAVQQATPTPAPVAAAPPAAPPKPALNLPSLEVSLGNLYAQYNALSADLSADYNSVVGSDQADYNPPEKLINKIYLVALLTEYQSLSAHLRNVYDSTIASDSGFYNNTLQGIKNKWDFISGALAPLAAQGYASGTMNTAQGWIRVGERGPELMHQGGGNIVLPNGVFPTANDNSGVTELRALREEVAALRRQLQGGQVQASRDAKIIADETANVGRKVLMVPPTRRTVA